jgi:hypothetical protein
MPGKSSKSDDQYSPEESKARMIAALKGARLAGHVPMKAKQPKKKRAAKKKPTGKQKSA